MTNDEIMTKLNDEPGMNDKDSVADDSFRDPVGDLYLLIRISFVIRHSDFVIF
jgi:hypothetical protein